MYTEEHLYAIALRRCKLIGDIHFRQLVQTVGSAKGVWENASSNFKDYEGLKGKKLSDIGNPEHLKFAEKEIKFCEENNIKILLRHKQDFPFLLEQCEDAPAILYQKGTFPNIHKYISIVGTRKITHYGKAFLDCFFDEVQPNSFCSVSGLALGTDTAVHQQSLRHDIPTVGVLAHGFHTFYPARNRSLAEEMIEKGGVVITEFNTSQKPDREHFIQRNRVVAGLSSTAIIVESAYAGGSISTATFANDYHREVFALPGKVTDKFSQGCNKLIFDNKARIIVTAKELAKELELVSPHFFTESLFPQEKIVQQVPPNLKSIYEVVFQFPNITLDDITIKAQMSSQRVSGILLELELLGLIKTLSGKRFLAI